MKKIYLKDENLNWKKFDYELLSELSDALKKRNITIEAGAMIGAGARIGDNAMIEAGAKIGDMARIGKYNSFFANNLYNYPCGAWIEEKRGEMVQLGCFTRTRKEWEADFWNNNDEFPNDNSEKSNARLRAFQMCCNFLDLIKK